MRATFLGTADGHTSLERLHSGIFLRWEDSTLLLDCGAPAAQFLRQEQLDPDQPDLIWLSHMHSDHIGSFPSLIQSLWLRARRAPLHVYAPRSVIATLQDYLEKCLLFPELIGFPVEWHEIDGKKKFTHKGLTLTPITTQHLQSLAKFFKKGYPETCFDCYGLLIEKEGDRVVYSADLATPKDLKPFLKKPLRALICELTHFPEKTLFEELAKAEPIKKVFLTHYPDHLVKRQTELRKMAKSCSFTGEIRLMNDGESANL